MNFRKKSKRPLIHLLENHVANLLRKTSEKKTDIKVQKCDGLDWMGLVIIGHRSSKSTFGASKGDIKYPIQSLDFAIEIGQIHNC